MRLLIDTTTVVDVVIVIVLVMAITLTRATDTLSSLVALDHMRVSPMAFLTLTSCITHSNLLVT